MRSWSSWVKGRDARTRAFFGVGAFPETGASGDGSFPGSFSLNQFPVFVFEVSDADALKHRLPLEDRLPFRVFVERPLHFGIHFGLGHPPALLLFPLVMLLQVFEGFLASAELGCPLWICRGIGGAFLGLSFLGFQAHLSNRPYGSNRSHGCDGCRSDRVRGSFFCLICH
jgi:hypothetical protein